MCVRVGGYIVQFVHFFRGTYFAWSSTRTGQGPSTPALPGLSVESCSCRDRLGNHFVIGLIVVKFMVNDAHDSVTSPGAIGDFPIELHLGDVWLPCHSGSSR